MATRTVLVLGGGVGGVVAANELRARLPAGDRVVVVDRERDQLFAPSLLWLMVGMRRPERLTKPIARYLRSGVELVTAEVQAIDPAGRHVETSTGELVADALVIALGAELAPETTPGYAEAAHDFFALDGAASFAGALAAFAGGRVAIAVTALPFKCPAAPYEAALLVDADLRRRALRERSEIDVYTPEPAPMPVAGPAMGRAVVALLDERGIRFHPNRPVRGYDPAGRSIAFADGGLAEYDLLAAVPPHRSPSAVRESGLANPGGWIPVDSRTLATSAEDVYAVGDCSAIPLSNGKFLPKAGVFAHAEALVVADRIAAGFGAGAAPEFDGVGYCWVELGAGRAAFAVGEFFAEPDPTVALRRPGRVWHAGKVAFERYWLGEGGGRTLAALGLRLGSRLLGIPARL